MMSTKKPLKKTSTFLLQKSSSTVGLPTQSPEPETVVVGKKLPVFDFPTSPQLYFGEEILHFSHPQHSLSQINLPDLFTCSGCKEYGSGKRYTCLQCDYQLHEFCALASPVLKAHPLHFKHQLVFYSKAVKSGIMKSKCDACGKAVKGYAFRCSACSFQMHPCCAMLSAEMNLPIHPHALKLLPAVVNAGDSSALCGECKRRRSGQVFQCTVCGYHLHAVCAKNLINGLHANGIKGPEKPSMLGTAAKLASQVVTDFIGGLIEGLGEGVGEAFLQNVAKGKGSSGSV